MIREVSWKVYSKQGGIFKLQNCHVILTRSESSSVIESHHQHIANKNIGFYTNKIKVCLPIIFYH